MSCPYYTWRSDYYCTKNQSYVNSDVYQKHCKNYDYDYCPIYKDEPVTSGCFLTSACVEAMGLPDDCDELMTLRAFRDTWLVNQPGGKAEIAAYYRVAPGIVHAIQKRRDRQSVLQRIYEEMVCPCVASIKEKRYDEAWESYRKMTEKLRKEYHPSNDII